MTPRRALFLMALLGLVLLSPANLHGDDLIVIAGAHLTTPEDWALYNEGEVNGSGAPAWESLAHAAGVIGKQVHDARLVAICQVASVASILTFNVAHFTMLATFVSGLTVVGPMTV